MCKRCGCDKHGPLCGLDSDWLPEEKEKIDWVMRCVVSDYPGCEDAVLSERVQKACDWHSRTTAQERIEFRENMVRSIERADAEQRSSGMLEAYYRDSVVEIREVLHLVSSVCIGVCLCCNRWQLTLMLCFLSS